MRRAAVLAVVVTVVLATPGIVGAVDDVFGGDDTGVLDTGGSGASEGPAATAATQAATNPRGVTSAAGATGSDASTANATGNGSNGTVAVGTGTQLSTVLETTEEAVGTAVSQSAFESRFRAANETERAELVADRAATLRRDAEAVVAAVRNATRRYTDGTINRSTYAQRLATLAGRADSLRASIDHLERRAANVSDLELAAAGFDPDALDAAAADLASVSGTGPTALFQRFTGRSNGTVTIATGPGVSIDVESEDGERSRDVRRATDDDRSLSVPQDAALETARGALTRGAWNWTLRNAAVSGNSGAYTFAFGFVTGTATGEATVRVDGSTGDIVRLEEEIETRESDDGDDGPTENGTAGELVVLVVDGQPAPGATLTLEARRGDTPVADATVRVDDALVGETDADGRVDVALSGEETTVEVTDGEDEAELEFEFESDSRRGPPAGLNLTATLDDGQVSLTVTYRGDAVPGAQVAVDGDRLGPTGPDGTVTFPLDTDSEAVEVSATRGALEVERTYRVENGSLVAGEGDDDQDDDSGDGDDSDDGDDGDDSDDSDDGNDEDGPGNGEGPADPPGQSGDDDSDDDGEDDEDGPGNGGPPEDPPGQSGDDDGDDDSDEDDPGNGEGPADPPGQSGDDGDDDESDDDDEGDGPGNGGPPEDPPGQSGDDDSDDGDEGEESDDGDGAESDDGDEDGPGNGEGPADSPGQSGDDEDNDDSDGDDSGPGNGGPPEDSPGQGDGSGGGDDSDGEASGDSGSDDSGAGGRGQGGSE